MKLKPMSFSEMKKIQKMSLNQLNRWTESLYKHGVQDGIDFIEKEASTKLTEDELYSILISVKGIGEKRAAEVMRRISGSERGDGGDRSTGR